MMATKDLLDVVVRIVVTETLQARAAPRGAPVFGGSGNCARAAR